MNKKQRYIRQTSLPNFSDGEQAELQQASVLIVGCGGLGIPVAQYLNAMGIGTLGLVEQDVIDIHNLQRQVLYSESEVGQPKIEVALRKLKAQNSETNFKLFDSFLTKTNALEIIQNFDVVVDATDNFATRYLINDACVILNKPFVYGALHGFEGQVSVFNHKKGPTYRCLFPTQPNQDEIPNCNENGVLGVIPGIIGTLQALEVVKVLTEVGEVLSGKLLLYDGLSQSMQKINFNTVPENKKLTALQESYDFEGCITVLSISSEEFSILHENEKLQIIDVRTQKEFKRECLGDSINIPLSELQSNLEKVDFEQPVYLLCQSGQRSKKAFELLTSLRPLADLRNVSGGLNNLAARIDSN